MSTTENTITASLAGTVADRPLVSVVIPCLNEAENIEACVTQAREALERNGIAGEVLVADNDSDDGSASWPRRPAPASCTSRAAATAAHTSPASPRRAASYIVMGDADLTYDFDEIPRFVAELAGRRRHGDRRPHGEHPPGRDAVAAPLRRQPAAVGLPQRAVQNRRARRALRHARAAHATRCRSSTCARPGWSSPPRW